MEGEPLRALIFDSYFDTYRGVVVVFRVFDGEVNAGDKIELMNTGAKYDVLELGVMKPNKIPVKTLRPGDVGYCVAGIKAVKDARVGDTITLVKHRAEKALAGYSEAIPMVYCGLFPTDTDRYNDLRDALEKLQLNDASLNYEPEVSSAMGFGFRCGFLGLLHMEVVQERLEREYDLDLITTAPSVVYHVYMANGDMLTVANPAELPDAAGRDRIEEPFVKLELFTPKESRWIVDGTRHPTQRRIHRHDDVSLPRSNVFEIRHPFGRSRDGLLRPTQKPIERLREHGIQIQRIPRKRFSSLRRHDQRRSR